MTDRINRKENRNEYRKEMSEISPFLVIMAIAIIIMAMVEIASMGVR